MKSNKILLIYNLSIAILFATFAIFGVEVETLIEQFDLIFGLMYGNILILALEAARIMRELAFDKTYKSVYNDIIVRM